MEEFFADFAARFYEEDMALTFRAIWQGLVPVEFCVQVSACLVEPPRARPSLAGDAGQTTLFSWYPLPRKGSGCKAQTADGPVAR